MSNQRWKPGSSVVITFKVTRAVFYVNLALISRSRQQMIWLNFRMPGRARVREYSVAAVNQCYIMTCHNTAWTITACCRFIRHIEKLLSTWKDYHQGRWYDPAKYWKKWWHRLGKGFIRHQSQYCQYPSNSHPCIIITSIECTPLIWPANIYFMSDNNIINWHITLWMH